MVIIFPDATTVTILEMWLIAMFYFTQQSLNIGTNINTVQIKDSINVTKYKDISTQTLKEKSSKN